MTADVARRAELDVELAALARAAAQSGQPPLTSLSVAEARARVVAGDALCADGPAVATRDYEIDGPGGRIRLREYSPRGPGRQRVVLYLHGGGWVTGDLGYSDELCRYLTVGCEATVVSVDYRLAPEHPFPAAPQDAWAALTWVAATYPDDGRLLVAGDSAGGALAAGLAARARDEDGPRVDGQLLVYPVLDSDLSRPSYVECANAFPLTAAAMSWFWDHYASDPADRVEPSAAPLRASTLAGLPPTVVVQAGHDPLGDEADAYADRLVADGSSVRVLRYASLGHGFLRMTGVCAAARDARTEIVGATDVLFETAGKRSAP